MGAAAAGVIAKEGVSSIANEEQLVPLFDKDTVSIGKVMDFVKQQNISYE